MDGMLQRLGLKEGEAIVHPWVNKALEKAQSKVEARNFDIRKNILKYDDVMNDQRKVIFEQRIELMEGSDVPATVVDMRHELIEDLVARHIPENAYPEQWDTDGLQEEVANLLNLDLPVKDWAGEEGIADQEIRARLTDAADRAMAARAARYGADAMRQVEKMVLLHTLDTLWREHLAMLDHLRQVVGLRGYAQRDPLNEYKTEAFALFETLLARLREAVTAQLMRVEIVHQPPRPALEDDELSRLEEIHPEPQRLNGRTQHEAEAMLEPVGGEARDAGTPGAAPVRSRAAAHALNPRDPATWGKVARNAPCPCGSGRKFKHCHGKVA
jgi:preprotein translocase subunit SecA